MPKIVFEAIHRVGVVFSHKLRQHVISPHQNRLVILVATPITLGRMLNGLFATCPRISLCIHLLLRMRQRHYLIWEHARDIFPDGGIGEIRRFDDAVYDMVCAFGCLAAFLHGLQPCDEFLDTSD
jgi:hypothetical protein